LSSRAERVDAGKAESSKPFDPVSLKREPGQPIKSKDWNDIVDEISRLRKYIDTMTETTVLTGLVSRIGRNFALDTENAPGSSFGARAVGLISSQWLAATAEAKSEICSFGITGEFDVVEYWACADNGDQETLDIELEYRDGTIHKAGENLYINSKTNLSGAAHNNRYSEYLTAPGGNWYRYQIKNKAPDKPVRSIKFINVNPTCITRIGNVLHLKSRIKQP